MRDMWPSLIPNDTPLSPTHSLTFPRSSFLSFSFLSLFLFFFFFSFFLSFFLFFFLS